MTCSTMNSTIIATRIWHQIWIESPLAVMSSPVAWSLKKQTTLAPSTPEAKYIAAAHIAKQVFGINLYSWN